MSNTKERPKLTPKAKVHDGHRNSAKGGLKRPPSNEEDVSTKKARQKPDTKCKYSASTRLSKLRDNIKNLPSTSKQPTSHIGPESPKLKSFKIPKKTVNDRLKIFKEEDLQKSKAFEKNIPRTTPLQSRVQNTGNKLKRKHSDEPHTSPLKKLSRISSISDEPHTSPLKKLSRISSISNSEGDCGVVPKQSKDCSQTSFRLSEDFIVVSDTSDNESNPKIMTPRLRLNIIKSRDRSSSSSSDKTLTPGSLNKSDDFKTPLGLVSTVRTPSRKITLNRNIFNEKVKNAVQTEATNIFTSTAIKNVQRDMQNKEQMNRSPTKNIFGVQVCTSNKSNNIFASSPTNNNSIVGHSDSNCIVQSKSSIFDRSPTQKRGNSIEKPTEEVFSPSKERDKNKYRGSATNRLEKIRNNETQSSNRPTNEEQILRNPFESPPVEKEIKPRLSRIEAISKGLQTQNWVMNNQGPSRDMDTTISDSLVVNVDDTILNKSELADPIEDTSMEWDSVPQSSEATTQVAAPTEEKIKENIICIVTDTNVFMHSLYKIKDILNMKNSGPQKVKIYVPWMVLKELDHLKDHSGEPTRSQALTAERYINKCLMEADSQLLGQSVHEVALQTDIGTTPDDKILSCCMQVAEKYKSVILLTSDINLRNKALVSQVETATPQAILSKLNPMLSKKVKFLEIRNKLATLWSMVICDCCKEAYGEPYKKMDMLQNPPWSMVECVKRFRKYWGGVFRQILLKQFKKAADEIYDFLVKHKDDIIDDSDLFNDFMKKVVEVMVFLRDISHHKNSIKKTLEEIVEVASRISLSVVQDKDSLYWDLGTRWRYKLA